MPYRLGPIRESRSPFVVLNRVRSLLRRLKKPAPSVEAAAALADVMQAETALHTAEYARIQAEASAKSSTATLAVLMGFDADQTLHLAPTKGADAPAMTAQIGDLLAAAARQRPDLAAARDQWSAAGEAVGSARASGRPRISFGAIESLSTLNGLPQQSGHSIGLTVTVPVFSGFATHYGIRRAEALEAQSAAELESARLGVSYDVWTAYHNLIAANDSLATSATLAKAAATNEDIAIGRYQSGVGSILDVLTAQTAGANARLIRIQSEYAFAAARVGLALAVGQLRSVADLDAVAPVNSR
jgi:outer membrane protein TolC